MSESGPYFYSNDNWTRGRVRRLDIKLALQGHEPETGAAIVIGSGGLPYLLAHLAPKIRTVYNVDLDPKVLETTRSRVDALARHGTWRTYETEMRSAAGRLAKKYGYERKRAALSGLRRDFAETKAAAEMTRLVGVPGDILVVASHIGRLASEAGQTIALVNLTNVGGYIGDEEDPYGRRIISDALRETPLSADTIIIDSSRPLLQPQLYTPEQYDPMHRPVR